MVAPFNAQFGGPATPFMQAPVAPKPAPKPKPVAIKPKAKPKAAPKKKSKPSALSKWLAGDDTYQQQISQFNKQKTDYTAQYNRQKQVTQRDYGESQRALNLQGTQDRELQANDFAGRGILRSGVYAKALGDYNTDFQTKLKNLVQGQTDTLGNLSDERTNFFRQIALELQAAKQDAIRRRAAQLGL